MLFSLSREMLFVVLERKTSVNEHIWKTACFTFYRYTRGPVHGYVHIEKKLIKRWFVGWDLVGWDRHTLEPTSYSPFQASPAGAAPELKGCLQSEQGLSSRWVLGQNLQSIIPWEVPECERYSAKILLLISFYVGHLPLGGHCSS